MAFLVFIVLPLVLYLKFYRGHLDEMEVLQEERLAMKAAFVVRDKMENLVKLLGEEEVVKNDKFIQYKKDLMKILDRNADAKLQYQNKKEFSIFIEW